MSTTAPIRKYDIPFGKCFRLGDILVRRHDMSEDLGITGNPRAVLSLAPASAETIEIVDGYETYRVVWGPQFRDYTVEGDGVQVFERTRMDRTYGPAILAPRGFVIRHPCHVGLDLTGQTGVYAVSYSLGLD